MKKFIHPTAAQLLKLASFVLVIVNTVLAFGATIHTIPGLSPNLAAAWPVIYGVAFGLHQLASNFGIAPDPTFQAQVGSAVQDAEQAVAAVQQTEATIASAKAAASSSLANANITNGVELAATIHPDGSITHEVVG